MTEKMISLDTQAQFEELLKPINSTGKPAAKNVVVYFTASWCGACKLLDFNKICSARQDIVWYKCDIDVNKYTLGYCGLTKIPSFAFINSGKFLGKITSSNTDFVISTLLESF